MDKPTQPTNPLSMPFECFSRDSRTDFMPVPAHMHYFAEIILVNEGTLRVRRDGTAHILPAGSLIFILPLIRHSVETADDDPVVYETIRLDLEQLGELPSYSPDLRSIMLGAQQEKMPMVLSDADVRRLHIEFMFHECVSEYQNRPYGYDLKISALLYLITVNLARFWIEKGYQPHVRSLQIDPLFTVTAYISRHINEPLKVEDLAAHCGLSYPWFARRFREIYGIPCKDYISLVRLGRVEHFLRFTDCDLNYICGQTGYSDPSHLVRDFRKYHNMTPGQFRANARKSPLRPGAAVKQFA